MKKNRLLVALFPVVCLAVILLTWGSLHGQAPADKTPALEPSNGAAGLVGGGPDVGGLAARVALSLVLIVVLILGAAYAVRFFDGRSAGARAGKVKVLDRCFLAPKRALYTVRMGERVVVVGVTDQSITPVLEFSEEEGGRLYPEKPPGGPPDEPATFAGVLRGIASRMGRTGE